MPKEIWLLQEKDLKFKQIVMDLQNILAAENVDLDGLQRALSKIAGVIPKVDPEVGGVSTAEEALNKLNLGFAPLRDGLAKFMEMAFTTTGKALSKEKRDLLGIISSGLTQIKKEFRLPARVEVKQIESKRANEAWNSLKDAYLNMEGALLNTIQDLNKGASKELAPTIAWSGDDIRTITDGIQKATRELLLVGILLKELYGKILTKALLEFGHRPYNLSFEALRRYKVGQRLKSAKRKAGLSEENRRKAIILLEEEKKLFIDVTDRWEKENHNWESKKKGIGKDVFQEQQRLIDKTLGVFYLETLLPEITEVALDSIKDLLEFIPSIEEIEHGQTSHGEEAEEIVDKLDNELDKITEFLEPKVDL